MVRVVRVRAVVLGGAEVTVEGVVEVIMRGRMKGWWLILIG